MQAKKSGLLLILVLVAVTATGATTLPFPEDLLRGEQRQSLPSAPDTAVTFRGAGSNIVYIDWENDLVVVVRWINGRSLDEFIGKVLASIEGSAPTDNAPAN